MVRVYCILAIARRKPDEFFPTSIARFLVAGEIKFPASY